MSSTQAVILVGGKGTRLRPLTSNRPKPIVPLVDRPFMAYMLEWVASHGVTDVVMCCGFLADAMGFTAYFFFTFVVTIPGMIMTWFVPHIAGPGAPPQRRP